MLHCINIPEDILILILKRLPIKSLLRFMTVSKSWNSLIASPFFINAHLNQETHPLILFHSYPLFPSTQSESFHLNFDNEPFERYLEFKFPYKRDEYSLEVIGSCNGVICLWDGSYHRSRSLFLWNPSIRKALKLPAPTFPRAHFVLSGFGFDLQSNDYKVVRVLRPNQMILNRSDVFQVYSHKARSWKDIIDVSHGTDTCSFSPYVQQFVNGVLHWLLFRRCENSRLWQPLVLCFNVNTGLFEVMMLPECMITTDATYMLISVYDNSLALLMRDPNYDAPFFHVWVMKEYGVKESWTKLFSISHRIVKWALFRKSGEILALNLHHTGIISYDPYSSAVRNLENMVGKHYGYISYFSESLALLNESNETSSKKKQKQRLLEAQQESKPKRRN